VLRRIGRVLFKIIPLFTWRVFLYAVFGVCLVVGGAILGLRYWLLPNIESYRADVEQAVARVSGQRITIGALAGNWEGLRPQVTLRDVRILGPTGDPAIVLDHVEGTLSWLTALRREPHFASLRVLRPHLALRRDAAGRLSIGGIDLAEGPSGGGLSDWVLSQREIIVRDARIDWVDEKLAAPLLALEGVTLRLYNEGGRHRVGLRARPPAGIASPLDLRADLTGGSVREPGRWEGTLFAQVDYADLAAWQQWIPFPIEVPRGAGAVRTWIDFAGDRVTHAIADVRLADVRTRIASHLPELDLRSLSGRIAWRTWSLGSEITTRQLALAADGNVVSQPVDLVLRRLHGDGRKPASGELTANALDLELLAELADHLPLDDGLRAELRRFEPRGRVRDLAVKWTGDWPLQTYQVRTRFEGLGIQAQGLVPGFTNAHGSVDASEKRGAMVLSEQRVVANLPRVFAQPIALDRLAAEITWTHEEGRYDLRFANVAFANADVAGALNGTYSKTPGSSGVADLTGALTRADARHLSRYLPLVVGPNTRQWLASSIVAGQSGDVRFRLKGDLQRFPFSDGKSGIFQVTARTTGGVVAYAEGWPRLEAAVSELDFNGSRMEIRISQATMLGARVARARTVIADLRAEAPVLEVSGEVEGPTAEFLRFIAESPVNAMIGRFTEGMSAQGRGQLGINLEIPLTDRAASRVRGNYQFVANRIVVDAVTPPIEQVNGRLEFTESGVRAAGITTSMLGGPATISGTTQGDGTVRLVAQGRANVDALRRIAGEASLLRHFSGATDWRGTLTLRDKLAEVVVESGLEGVTSSLPAPLAKAAGETIALRLERRPAGAQRDTIQVSWGNAVFASLSRRPEGRGTAVERVAVGLGAPAAPGDGTGLTIAGRLPALDADQWRRLLAGDSGGQGNGLPDLSAVDLRLGTVDVFGRRFHDVSLKGRTQDGRWVAGLVSREANGEITWRGRGRGQLGMRMKNLVVPAPFAVASAGPAQAAPDQPSDYPALDIVVEDFRHKERAHGRLELVAVPDGRDLRIDRLRITNPDATLAGDGVWRWNAREPRTQMNVRLEVNDVGRYFARMAYPEGVRGATARLEGAVNWVGAPQEIDFPSLSGTLVLDARKGQFVKLDPGIGKLLSILSLQALPRRITLDFKDVFSEGFTFDEIGGALKIQRGVASTEALRINGSSAKITMSGDVDLNREMQRLKVRVVPSVGDSVSTVTTLLGGPVAGLGVFLAQRLLNDPFGQLIAYEYLVTGTWSDPHVSRATPAAGDQAEATK